MHAPTNTEHIQLHLFSPVRGEVLGCVCAGAAACIHVAKQLVSVGLFLFDMESMSNSLISRKYYSLGFVVQINSINNLPFRSIDTEHTSTRAQFVRACKVKIHAQTPVCPSQEYAFDILYKTYSHDRFDIITGGALHAWEPYLFSRSSGRVTEEASGKSEALSNH